MNKTAKVLLIYDRLRFKGKINKKEIITELNICDATFENYMSEIRCHLTNSFNFTETLIYNWEEKDYRLVKSI